MADYIPFINNSGDCTRFAKHYSDAKAVRVLLSRVKPETVAADGLQTSLWLDAGIDGYDCLLTGKRVFDGWQDHIRQFDPEQILADPAFLGKPASEKARKIVFAVLDQCQSSGPTWISLPLLPIAHDNSRNRINRELAAAAGEWRAQRKFRGHLVLPLVFTHADQLKGRTQWKKTLDLAKKCYDDSEATIVWAVDSELSDQLCRAAFVTRFGSLIRFHEDLREALPGAAKIIAGPYWGMNLVLWARGLCDHPAVSLGAGYRYGISGAFAKKAIRFHMALTPLRRWAVASPELQAWIKAALARINANDPVYPAFRSLERIVDTLSTSEEAAKNQVAEAYKEWFDKIQGASPSGRTLAMYQDLSSAYVLGKQLPRLPKSEAPGCGAGKVAEQLMLHCL
jgi:hypothetical protein